MIGRGAGDLGLREAGLLIGESAHSDTVRGIRELVARDECVRRARVPLTMHLGPGAILLNMEVEFREVYRRRRKSRRIGRLEQAIRSRFPPVQRIFIEPARRDVR